MRHSYRDAIEKLAEKNVCCPACHGHKFITQEKERPCVEDGVPVLDRGKPLKETYDSYRCLDCGQQWTAQVELVWCCTVQYKEDVGDILKHNEPLDKML